MKAFSAAAAAARPVLLLGAPALREVCSPCDKQNDGDLQAEMDALVATLQHFREQNGFGRGIAAPQIGVTKRFLAVDMGSGARVLSNPTISWRSEESFTLFDDCMSLPWLLCKVRRHSSITVDFINEEGAAETWERLPRPLSEVRVRLLRSSLRNIPSSPSAYE